VPPLKQAAIALAAPHGAATASATKLRSSRNPQLRSELRGSQRLFRKSLFPAVTTEAAKASRCTRSNSLASWCSHWCSPHPRG